MIEAVAKLMPIGVDLLQLGVLLGIFRRLGQHSAAITGIRARLTQLEEHVIGESGGKPPGGGEQ